MGWDSARREAASTGEAAAGLLGLAGTAVGGAISMIKQARDEKRRREAIEELKTTVLAEELPELADRMIDGFAASAYQPSFDFAAVERTFYRQQVYRFLVFNIDEKFADAYFAREDKFERFGLRLPVAEVLERTAAEVKIDIGSGKALVEKCDAAISAAQEAYLTEARAKGGTNASRHHDAVAERKRQEEELKKQQEEARRQQEEEALRKASEPRSTRSGKLFGLLK